MSNATAMQVEEVKGAGLWLIAQGVALAATVGVILGLFVEPDPTLAYLWGLIIPLVPASLLVSPMLWRNVCPLATLNKLPGGIGGKGQIGARGLARLNVVGMILLGVLVTLRHVTFNGFNPSDGPALGVVIALVAVAALVLGLRYAVKIGFCNSLCPVLPVERLYGQSPLLEVNNPRCPECSTCTAQGCIDLGAEVSIPQVIGKQARSSTRWVLTGYGIFAASFPGFVLGYYLAADGALDTTPQVFLVVGRWSLGSYLLVAILARLSKAPARRFMPALAGAAAGIYYWFAGPILSRTLGIDGAADVGASAAAIVIRAAAFALIAWWLWRAYGQQRASAPAATSGATP